MFFSTLTNYTDRRSQYGPVPGMVSDSVCGMSVPKPFTQRFTCGQFFPARRAFMREKDLDTLKRYWNNWLWTVRGHYFPRAETDLIQNPLSKCPFPEPTLLGPRGCSHMTSSDRYRCSLSSHKNITLSILPDLSKMAPYFKSEKLNLLANRCPTSFSDSPFA